MRVIVPDPYPDPRDPTGRMVVFESVTCRRGNWLPTPWGKTGELHHAVSLATRDSWHYEVSGALWRLLERGCSFAEALLQVDDGCPEWRDIGGEA